MMCKTDTNIKSYLIRIGVEKMRKSSMELSYEKSQYTRLEANIEQPPPGGSIRASFCISRERPGPVCVGIGYLDSTVVYRHDSKG